MKVSSYQVQDDKFFKRVNGKDVEFFPTRIWCQDCGRRLSLKKFKNNSGDFSCPRCGNVMFLGFNDPE